MGVPVFKTAAAVPATTARSAWQETLKSVWDLGHAPERRSACRIVRVGASATADQV